MQDAWRAYLELALGLTEAPRRRAEKVARDLRDKSGATAGQLQSFVEELMSTSRDNRQELTRLVRYEVDRALSAVGLASADELARLAERVDRLEQRLREAGAEPAQLPQPVGGMAEPLPTASNGPPASGPATRTAGQASKQTTAKKATAKKATAKKATAKKATAKKAAKKGTPESQESAG